MATNKLTKEDLEDVKNQILNWSQPTSTLYLSKQHWEDILKAETIRLWARLYTLINRGWKIELTKKDQNTYIIWLEQSHESEGFELSAYEGIRSALIRPGRKQ